MIKHFSLFILKLSHTALPTTQTIILTLFDQKIFNSWDERILTIYQQNKTNTFRANELSTLEEIGRV